MARSALLNVMVQAAVKAGRNLARDFGEVQNLQVARKGPGDFVSNTDLKAEKIIYDELRFARPDYGFLMKWGGEEEGQDPQHRWIADSLSGEKNFLHGISSFAISIALERDKQIVAGVVYNPALDELYVAERGKGAFFNDRRMRVAGRIYLSDAMLCANMPIVGQGNNGRYLRELNAVINTMGEVRTATVPALDLAFIASGRFDGFWAHDLKAWDMAAGVILIRESGGIVSDFNDRQKMFENGGIITGNEKIHKKLSGVLQQAGD